MWQLKTIKIYPLAVSLGQEIGRGLAGLFWLKVSHEGAVQLSARADVLGRLERLEGLLSRRRAHSCGCGWEALTPHPKGSPTGCLGVCTMWQLTPPE